MNDRPVRVRFAPSPTGPLHIGGVRTALYNYLFAKKHNGTFILRIEDTDQTRFVAGAENYIIESLNWLNIPFQEGVGVGGDYGPYRQSERKSMYAKYAMDLVEKGLAYYAFDTSDDLNAMRDKLKAANMLPKYDVTSRMSMTNSLTLSADEVKRRLGAGDDYVIRIKLPRNEEVKFHDIIRGWVSFNTNQLDDKVLLKGDGMPTYHLANVVDDYLMKISHVIRGEEWLPSAPLHVMLYKFLGWEEVMPEFAHLPLLLKPDGNGKLSKRDGDRLGFPVFPLNWTDPNSGEKSSGYKQSGYLPDAVVNMLAFLGWHPSSNKEIFTIDELIEEFTLERVSKSGAKFDLEKAKWFNHKFMMGADSSFLLSLLKDYLEPKHTQNGEQYLKNVIDLMKEKVTFIPEILSKGNFFFETPITYDEKVLNKKWNSEVDHHLNEFSKEISSSLPKSSDEFEQVFNAFTEKSGFPKGKLMQPLRWAVTGDAGGPPIFDLLHLLGATEVSRRIGHTIKKFSV
jgi:glutamyl-tRNA synthetase